MSSRRFPPPWSVEETDACFIVRDEIDNLVIPVTFIGAGTLRVAVRELLRRKP